MIKMIENRLLLGSIVALLVYWIGGLVFPGNYIALAPSIILVMAGGFTLYRYTPATYEIVLQNRRSDDTGGDGSHFAVYGIFLLSAGSVYSGLFNVAWFLAGQPSDWLGTAMSGFGRALMAGGFFLMYLSPSVAKGGIKLPNAILVLISLLLASALIFVAGFKYREVADDLVLGFYRNHGLDRAICPNDRPVWAGTTRYYHTPTSKYRGQIIPRKCFKTEEEAQQAGYVAPK